METLERMITEVAESIQSPQEAVDVLIEAAKKRDVDPQRVMRAITFLEKQSRKKDNKDPDPEAAAKKLRQAISGDWRLIFTTGKAIFKGTLDQGCIRS